MADINHLVLSGRLARNPELKYTASGTPYAKFDLAMDYSKKEGDSWTNATMFFNRITIWGKQAETFERYVRQGDQVFIEGELGINEWEKDGQKRRDVQITCRNFRFGAKKGGGSIGDGGGGGGRSSSPSPQSESKPPKSYDPPSTIDDDDIPF